MKKYLIFVLVVVFCVVFLLFVEEVCVYNWFDYIDESLLEKFEIEIGIKLIYDVFDSNEVLEIKFLVGGFGYDVVVLLVIFL